MRYIFLLSFLILLASCTKPEFYLEFDMAEDITENYDVTYYASDNQGGLTVQAVASVREGKCSLKGITKHPTLLFITRRRNPLPLVLLANKGEKIEIKGTEISPLLWNIDGNEINKEMSQWRLLNEKLWKECEPDSVNAAVARYVDENPENPVATILMQCYFNRGENEMEYSELMASLKGKAKKQEWLKICGRTDQLYHSYSYPAQLKSLTIRSLNKDGDTLRIDGKNPVFLLFWENGYANRKNMIDSIKVLRKEFPDSLRIIADICLDIDSVAWRGALRRDSLDNMIRFWAPQSLVDPTIMKFKVNSIPYFIVFDPDGKQSYRGDDLQQAMEDYRRLMRENQPTKKNV